MTLEAINTWLAHWEPTWLFCFIAFESLVGVPVNIYMAYILTKEYWYDKEWNERRAARRKKQAQFDSLTAGEGR